MTSLVKKLEESVTEGSKCGSFVVVLTDDTEKTEAKLKEIAEKEKLKKVILTIDGPQGPPPYKISKDAEVTVLIYDKKKVTKNYAFEKGKFSDKDVEAIAKDFKELLSAK